MVVCPARPHPAASRHPCWPTGACWRVLARARLAARSALSGAVAQDGHLHPRAGRAGRAAVDKWHRRRRRRGMPPMETMPLCYKGLSFDRPLVTPRQIDICCAEASVWARQLSVGPGRQSLQSPASMAGPRQGLPARPSEAPGRRDFFAGLAVFGEAARRCDAICLDASRCAARPAGMCVEWLRRPPGRRVRSGAREK